MDGQMDADWGIEGDAGRARAESAGLPRKILLSLVVTALLLVGLEGCTSAFLAWRDSGGPGIREELHCAHDPDLGWVNRPSVHVADLYGEHRSLTTNARGFRATEEYTVEIPAGRYRVVCSGDSFTLGYGVDDSETYPAWLEKVEPRIQAVNMGQGGYGVDQAYLWYRRDGTEIDSDLVIFGFIAPDFDRMLDARFNGLYSKPVLGLVDGKLGVGNVPVPDDFSGGTGRRLGRFFDELSTFDFLERLRGRGGKPTPPPPGTPLPYEEVGGAMLAELAALCAERDQDLALVMFPLRDRSVGRAVEAAAWLRGVSADLGVPFWDLTDDFEALPKSRAALYYQDDGHLNGMGNQLVAELLVPRLRERFDRFPR